MTYSKYIDTPAGRGRTESIGSRCPNGREASQPSVRPSNRCVPIDGRLTGSRRAVSRHSVGRAGFSQDDIRLSVCGTVRRDSDSGCSWHIQDLIAGNCGDLRLEGCDGQVQLGRNPGPMPSASRSAAFQPLF